MNGIEITKYPPSWHSRSAYYEPRDYVWPFEMWTARTRRTALARVRMDGPGWYLVEAQVSAPARTVTPLFDQELEEQRQDEVACGQDECNDAARFTVTHSDCLVGMCRNHALVMRVVLSSARASGGAIICLDCGRNHVPPNAFSIDPI